MNIKLRCTAKKFIGAKKTDFSGRLALSGAEENQTRKKKHDYEFLPQKISAKLIKIPE